MYPDLKDWASFHLVCRAACSVSGVQLAQMQMPVQRARHAKAPEPADVTPRSLLISGSTSGGSEADATADGPAASERGGAALSTTSHTSVRSRNWFIAR